MASRHPATCPLKVYIAADSDAHHDSATSFVEHLTGVDAEVVAVEPAQLVSITRSPVPGQPQLAVLAVDDAESSIDGVTAAAIAMDSPTPVMVVHPPDDGDRELPAIRRVVVPLDGSSRAAQALPLASHMARGAGVPMYLVTIIDPSRVIPPSFAYDPDSFLLVKELRETAHWALKQAESPLIRQGIEVHSDLLYGSISSTLVSLMRPDDLVVMTTHGTGRAQDLIGSVAARVLASAPCPVVMHRGSTQESVVADGYEACAWVEPLSRQGALAHR